MEQNFNFQAEFDAVPESAETHEVIVPEGAVKVPEAGSKEADGKGTERQLYTLKDGSQGSRAAYIRELFLIDNLSRKEIAEREKFPYRIVYGATVNLTNDAEPAGRGRAVTNPIVKVYGDEQRLVQQSEDGSFYDVETKEAVEATEVKELPRNTWIKNQVEAGASRGDIAKKLDLSYGVVYSLTKDLEGTRMRYDIQLEDGTTIPRSAYIRQEFAAGRSRGDIAKELDVPYAVVWQATKTEKSATKRFEELVVQFETFKGKTNNEQTFAAILKALKTISIVEVEETAETAEESEESEA